MAKEEELKFLQRIVWSYVISNPRLSTQRYGQKRIIRTLFEIYLEAIQNRDLSFIPPRFVKEYLDLVYGFGSEYNIVVEASEEELFVKMPEKIALGVKRVRDQELAILPGYDGEYGTIKIFDEKTEGKKASEQMTLF